ncbi:DUF559 domain-containing protein [Micromonospora sp. NPDC126480]|uniref:endonuclease domain-containing protein n=1 Tax=Micromonospora sp. NPDC126480 TaxID=3155312 RepID=UPI003324DD89
MPEEPHRYSELLAAGHSREVVRRQTASGQLKRLTRGVYGPDDSFAARLQATFRRLPYGAVAGFHTGAGLHGFGMSGTRDIHVIVPAGSVVPQIAGVVAHESVLPVRDPVLVAGVPCAPASRCAVDLARVLPRMDALPVLDACLRGGACRREDLASEVAWHSGLRGVCQARRLVQLADPRSECRQESQLRLLLVDGGLPCPEPQLWVPDEAGVPLYRLDLGYRRRRIGLEYDGASHLDRERLRHDRSRMNWLAAHGWRVRYFTDRDLYRHPRHIVATVADLLRS